MNYENLENYKKAITPNLNALPHLRKVAFAAWCADRLFEYYKSSIRKEFEENGVVIFSTIIDEIWSKLVSGHILSYGEVESLKMNLNILFPENPIDPQDLDPMVADIGNVGWVFDCCLESCLNNKVDYLIFIVEATVEHIHSHLECNLENYNWERLFSYPEMADEIKSQKAIIKHFKTVECLKSDDRTLYR